MQTNCPQCKASNEFDLDIVEKLGGRIRCTSCMIKFDPREKRAENQAGNSGNSDDQTEHSDKIEPTLDHVEDDDAHNIRFTQNEEYAELFEPQLEPQDTNLFLDDEPSQSAADENIESSTADVNPFETDVDDSSQEQGEESNKSNAEDSDALKKEIDDLEENLDESFLENEKTFTEDPDNKTDVPEERSYPTLESVSEEVDQQIQNNQSREEPTGPGFIFLAGRLLSFIFWTLAAVALVYLLFGQIKDRLYPAYKDHAAMQSLRTMVCGYLPCGVDSEAIDLFEIAVSRMDEVKAPNRQIHISIFLLNKAAHELAYPNILITLKQLDGKIAAQRVISPEEYITSHDGGSSASQSAGTAIRPLIKPNKLGKILIKLDNPPETAVGFEAKVVR